MSSSLTNFPHHSRVFVDAVRKIVRQSFRQSFRQNARPQLAAIGLVHPGPALRATILVGLLLTATAALAAAGAAFASDYHSNPWLLSWIPPACCVTNDCCWEITESEVRPLAGDRWEILSTGQVNRRTDWSPDGKFYRCACDYTGKQWIKHQGANTRCLFVPLRSALLSGR